VVVVADHPAGEALAEDVAVPSMARVEALCVDAVQVLHPGRELLDGRLDDEVVVRAHEAERMALPAVAPDHQREQSEEVQAVGIVDEHQPAENAARGDLEDPVGKLSAANPGHTADRTRGSARRSVLWTNRHELGSLDMPPRAEFGGQTPGHGGRGRGRKG
jgi:hypothetical protein